MVSRIHYRRHKSYRTPSNRVRKVKVPGARVVYQHVKKSPNRPKCGDCARPIHGVPALAPHQYKLLKKRERTVSRAYGGSRCHACVRQRIIRAFLVEEQKCVKQVLQVKEKQKKDEMKAEQKKTKTKKPAKKQ